MITYERACQIAREQCPYLPYVSVVDIEDRWSFTFSVYAPDDWRSMTPAPSFYVFKEDGSVEWFSIPPLENLDLIQTGRKIKFVERIADEK